MSGKEFLKPHDVPEPIGKYLVSSLGLSMAWVYKLKSIMKPDSQTDVWNFRLYDETEIKTQHLKIKDFTSLDGYPKTVRYEGIYNSKTQTVELKTKS